MTACGHSTAAESRVSEQHQNSIALELRDPNAPVLIAGFGTLSVRLWIDLGDRTPLTLQKSVLDAIHAVPTGKTVRLQGMDGEYEVATYTVPQVRIGDAVFTDVIANLDAPRDGYLVSPTEGGSLGSGLLKAYAVVLDYPHRRMVLLPGSSAAHDSLCRGTVVKFSVRSPAWKGEAVTDADTDFGRVTLWWDTGAQATMLLPAVTHATDRLISRRFMLGGRNFGPWSFGVIDAPLPGFDGAVGDDFFKAHRVCVDYPRSSVVIGD